MLQTTRTYTTSTRQLTVTDRDGIAAAGELRQLILLTRGVRQFVGIPGALSASVVFPGDGVYQLVLAKVAADLTTVLDESEPFLHIETAQHQRAFADLYLRHSLRPYERGTDTAYRVAWVRLYKTRNAAAEQNLHLVRATLATPAPATAFATQPATSPLSLLAPGLPAPAPGVYYLVDSPTAGTMTVIVDMANADTSAVTCLVFAPKATKGLVASVTTTPQRLTFTAPVSKDGIYRLEISLSGSPLATLYVPVQREQFRVFAAEIRNLALTMGDRAARIDEGWLSRAARLIGVEAAARTGNPALATALAASAAALPGAPTPTALYPFLYGK
ncbi:hypothetical protein [Hymenobacter metallicola]|uniref:Uncharacterized protein n=1 Tax=Hymenobacter metallicola TaxID=2563114 RepID=A0A4Z0QJC7_9BACT|nr:hypothetical protein [Hymenobacter metallicola]TGE29795.1 hypothetical protein E5K02_10150 [Hymenobacter metallicola]